MSTNLDCFKKDLDRLIGLGQKLQVSMEIRINRKEIMKQIADAIKEKDKREKYIESLPIFEMTYEAWYSESIALLKQILPDRVDNFISLYEKPRSRKELSHENYVIQDFLQGLVSKNGFGEIIVDISAASPQFRQQLHIVEAAKARFESSLFDIRQIVQADLFDREIDAARELHKNKFLRAAGAIAGVVLEKHLVQVCNDHRIHIAKKHPGIADLNELLKANGVIDIPQWRNISMLGDIRNICDHNKLQEPTSEQVNDLIIGTDKVLKTIL